MLAKGLLLLVVSLCSSCAVIAYPAPMAGSENIPKMMSDATLVCKGEVTAAPVPVFRNDGSHFDVTATVRMDRCYKGNATSAEVLFDGVQSMMGPNFILKIGDYDLFFLKPDKNNYTRIDPWFGVLPVSKLIAPNSYTTDPMLKLEDDLETGLHDNDPELIYDSIEMLGNLRTPSAPGKLKNALVDADDLKKTYIWEALLKLKDYSVLPEISTYILAHPLGPTSRILLLPRDRVLYMETRLFAQIGTIRDAGMLPHLHKFALSTNESLRMYAVEAIRAIRSPTSADVLLDEVDDSNADTAMMALFALAEMAGGDWPKWIPNDVQFRAARDIYSEKAHEWWRSEGQQRAVRSCHCDPPSITLKDRLE